MKYADDEKTTPIVNDFIRLSGIPVAAHQYQVNGRTPLEWFIDRYRITRDKESGIVNDPNGWFDDPRDLIAAVRRIVHVSAETVHVVEHLPEPFESPNRGGILEALRRFAAGRGEYRLHALMRGRARGRSVTRYLSGVSTAIPYAGACFDELAHVSDVEFRSLSEVIDTGSAGGKLVFHVFAALAEFERSLLRGSVPELAWWPPGRASAKAADLSSCRRIRCAKPRRCCLIPT